MGQLVHIRRAPDSKHVINMDIELSGQMQGDTAEMMSAAQSEVKKLNEQVSQLRQENITLKVNPFYKWPAGVQEVFCSLSDEQKSIQTP